MQSSNLNPSTSETPSDPDRKTRTIILCFDGTGNRFSDKNTNIARLFSMLKKDEVSQLCYYQAGIGTYIKPGTVSPFLRSIAKYLDRGLAWYLGQHVIDGYVFLMQNYRSGDKVCLFGYSRGAHIARVLAGMLNKIGLLPKDNVEQIPFAYKVYKSWKREANTRAAEFKNMFCREMKIDFLGVWDTVASVGYLYNPSALPLVGTNNMIGVFRHALSLDERRAKFYPTLYYQPDSSGSQEPPSRVKRWTPSSPLQINFQLRRLDPQDPFRVQESGKETDVLEVWFSGCHADVGGGSTKDSEDHALSNISLRWMVREVVKAKCGVKFDEIAASKWNIRKEHLEYLSDASAVEKFFDTDDAQKQKVDKLELNQKNLTGIVWWALEVTPTFHEFQDENGQWWKQLRVNRGRGRKLPDSPTFHRSVLIRQSELGYSPKATYKGEVKYVD